ncbi:hypothetical protein UlMin_041149 [Ulmus minor]
MEDLTSSACNLGILETLTDDNVQEIVQTLLGSSGDLSVGSEFVSYVHSLCKHGLESLVRDHFLRAHEETFEKNGAFKFWRHFDAYGNASEIPNFREDEVQEVLYKALEEISTEKQYQEKCLLMLVHALQSSKDRISEGSHNTDAERAYLFSKYQLLVSSVLMATLPRHFPEILHWYFKGRLEELSTIMAGELNDDGDDEIQHNDGMGSNKRSRQSYGIGQMEIDESSLQGRFSENNKLVKNIGKVVRDLRNLGFTSMTEDAYASAIFLLLKSKVHDLAGEDYRSSVLESIKGWIQAVPLQFLHALLAYLGDCFDFDSVSSGLKSPLASRPSSFYPGNDKPSEGLVRWQLRLEYFAYETLQDLRIAKLFEIIVDYPDSLPAIEDLKQCLEYTGQHSKLVESFISALRYRLLTAGASTNDILGRKDTIKCIVTMLTDGTGGNSNISGNTGDSLLEELNRDEESQENSGLDDILTQMTGNWEPDPVEADPLKGSRNRRKVDILGMIVGIIGSKDQLVNEYRVMLAEKLLNKSDYDIDTELRTLELLKDESLIMPQPVDRLLSDYAKRFNEIKTPRKLLWKKNLGAVKLELEFEDRVMQFTVAPVHAAIIMKFQDQASWTLKNLAAAIGAAVDVLSRRIHFWISKGVLAESFAADTNDHIFTLIEGVVDTGKSVGVGGSCEDLPGDEEGDRSVASVEDQLRKEMTVYEKFIIGMLTNFGVMALERIHNTIKMFCVADPSYDKTLQQLQSFLTGLVSEEKLELRDGMYSLKR